MMDKVGIDVAFLTSAAGMCTPISTSRAMAGAPGEPNATIPAASSAPRTPIRWAARSHFASSPASTNSAFPGGQCLPRPATSISMHRSSSRSGRNAPGFRPVRFRASGAEAQSDPAVRRLRHRALGWPRVLAGDGDHPAGQFRRIRPPSLALTVHMSHLGGGLSPCSAASAPSGQGFLGHIGQRPPWSRSRTSTTIFATTWCSTPPVSAARSAPSGGALIGDPAARIVHHRLSAGDPRARRGGRLRQGVARARQGRRGDPVRQRRQAHQATGQGGVARANSEQQMANSEQRS